MTAALKRKTEPYEELVTTITGNGFECQNIPLEIRTRGLINARNKNVLTKLCHGLRVTKVSSVIKNCSKLALLGSYTIWNARYSTNTKYKDKDTDKYKDRVKLGPNMCYI